jgi:hypothetical protein
LSELSGILRTRKRNKGCSLQKKKFLAFPNATFEIVARLYGKTNAIIMKQIQILIPALLLLCVTFSSCQKEDLDQVEVSGVVKTTCGGQPVSGLDLQIWQEATPGYWWAPPEASVLLGTTTTRSDGSFTFSFPPPTYTCSIRWSDPNLQSDLSGGILAYGPLTHEAYSGDVGELYTEGVPVNTVLEWPRPEAWEDWHSVEYRITDPSLSTTSAMKRDSFTYADTLALTLYTKFFDFQEGAEDPEIGFIARTWTTLHLGVSDVEYTNFFCFTPCTDQFQVREVTLANGGIRQ